MAIEWDSSKKKAEILSAETWIIEQKQQVWEMSFSQAELADVPTDVFNRKLKLL